MKKISTYDTQSFRKKYMEEKLPEDMLKQDFGKFFIVKVEEMLRIIKLPVPPIRSLSHSCIFLTEGEATMNIGTSLYRIVKDEFLFVPAGCVFSFAKQDVNKGYLIHFQDDMLLGKISMRNVAKEFEFLQVWGNPYVKLGKETSAAIVMICKRLYREYQENGIKTTDIIQPYLVALLAEVSRRYRPVSSNQQIGAVRISNEFKVLVFKNVKKIHRVSEYADILNVSPNHLNKVVKSVTGKSPGRWIDEAIVLEAKVLLFQSDLSIQAIAEAVGFLDQSYFSRLFKKYEKLSPLEFRKRIEKS